MQSSIFNRRIPILFAVLLLIVGLGATTYFVQTGALFIGRASPATQPQNIQVTNITDRSFSVTFTTPEKTASVISYGTTESLGQTALDDRDKKSGAVNSYESHQITIVNLNPQTTYYYTILNGQETYSDNEKPYTISTGPSLSAGNPPQKLLSGKVISGSSQKVQDGLVYANLPGSQLLSTLLEEDGNFQVSLQYIRASDLKTYFQITDVSPVTIRIDAGPLGASEVTASASQINPLPPITLSQNYKFEESTLSPTPSSVPISGFPLSASSLSQTSLKIVTPKANATFTDAQPVFTGTAPAGEIITITIHSDENIQEEVVANSRGEWSFRPSKTLSPGAHTLTISGKDAAGVVRTITRTFTIFESGTQVSEAATPSATTSPTSTPTKTPIPTQVPSGTIAPTTTPTPTNPPVIPTNTPIPQFTPAPTVVQQPIESPGRQDVMLGIIIATTMLFGAGVFLTVSRRKIV